MALPCDPELCPAPTPPVPAPISNVHTPSDPKTTGGGIQPLSPVAPKPHTNDNNNNGGQNPLTPVVTGTNISNGLCTALNNVLISVGKQPCPSSKKTAVSYCVLQCFQPYYDIIARPPHTPPGADPDYMVKSVIFTNVENLTKDGAGVYKVLYHLFNDTYFSELISISIDATVTVGQPPPPTSGGGRGTPSPVVPTPGSFPTTIHANLKNTLTSLQLIALNLEGSLPSYIAELNALTTLSVPFSQITNVTNFPSKLTNLDLKSNRIEGTVPAFPAGIQSISLGSNLLTGTIPSQVYTLSFLKILVLDFNKLEGTIELFPQSTLNFLMLASNEFESLDLRNFESKNLIYLHVDGNYLENVGKSMTINISDSIKSVKLQNNRLSGNLTIHGGCGLLEISIKNNAFSGALPQFTTEGCKGGASVLQMIDFSNNQFRGAVSFYFHAVRFPKLTFLSLENNFLTTDIFVERDRLSAHACMTDGCTLKLSGNRLPSTLTGLPSILHSNNLLNIFSTNYELVPQDVDECVPGFKPAPKIPVNALCSDGWEPKFSYTWKCLSGYERINNAFACSPTCGDSLVVPGELCDPKVSEGCDVLCQSPRRGWLCSNTSFSAVQLEKLYVSDASCYSKTTKEVNLKCVGYCLPICGDGLMRGEKCDDGNDVDGDGCTKCTVDPGYVCDSSEPSICTDINECIDIEQTAEITRKCDSTTRCSNLVGAELFGCCPIGQTPEFGNYTGRCLNCVQDWKTNGFNNFTSYPNLENFLENLGIDLEGQGLSYQSCLGVCTVGQRMSTRKILRSGCFDGEGEKTDKIELCGFPCVNVTSSTATESVYRFIEEISRGDFLKELVFKIFNTTIEIDFDNSTKKRRGEVPVLEFSLDDCTRSIEITGAITALATDILPDSINQLVWQNLTGSCHYGLTYQTPRPISLLLLGCVGLAILLCAALLIAICFYRQMKKSVLIHLPEDIAWSYELCEKAITPWKRRGTDDMCYYFQEMNGSYFQKAKQIFDSYLGGSELQVSTIIAVYNPTLVTNFVNTFLIYQKRCEEDRKTFFQETWGQGKGDVEKVRRGAVFKAYESKVLALPWNKDVPVGIIPAVHGTDQFVAEKICETGFAALSSLDAGFYGKGIYFSTTAIYTLPYFGTRKNPALIISWLFPGNVYPVIEHRQNTDGLIGAAIKAGYNSHYVHVTNRGDIPDSSMKYNPEERDLSKKIFDEIVIAQENQICPAFIVTFQSENLTGVMNKFTRNSMQSASPLLSAAGIPATTQVHGNPVLHVQQSRKDLLFI